MRRISKSLRLKAGSADRPGMKRVSSLSQLKSKRGFGIMEVLVAGGLLTIIFAGVMNLMSTASKSQRGIQAKDQQREDIAEIRALLQDKGACIKTFGGRNPASTFMTPAIKDQTGVNQYAVGSNDKSSLLSYTGFTVQNYTSDVGNPAMGKASLVINQAKTGDTLGAKAIAQQINLRVQVDGSGNITDCYSLGSNSDNIWQITPSNFSNIYYGAGSVGVGTTAPVSTLDVSGEVRVGSTGVGCSPANEGATRYNVGIHNMEFCNGANWKKLGGPSSNVVIFSPWVGGGANSATCPVGYLLTQCLAETNTGDGQSLLFEQHFIFTTDASGNTVGCSSTMSDSADQYRIVAICLQ